LLFIGAFGHRIELLKYGGAEIHVAAELLSQARAAGARGDDERKEALIGAALAASGVSSGLSSDITIRDKRRLHQDAVLNALSDVYRAESGALEYRRTPIAAVATVGNAKMGVDVRSSPKSLDEVLSRVKRHRADKRLDIDGLLIVFRTRSSGTDFEALAADASRNLGIPVRLLRWRPEHDEATLADAATGLVNEIVSA
jgi:hypothetical protein